MKLLTIDGNSIINRAFYGIKLLTTKDGQYTNAIYGFINILNRLIETEAPEGVVVAFDLKAPTFRHKMYEKYKAGRKPMPKELAEQLPILKRWLCLAGYCCVECEGYEADDILGTLAHYCEQSGNQCVISTGDRDSLQLISDKTRVLLAATKMGRPEIINYDVAALFEKYGLTPAEMLELKSLMGDSSDNIPGVAGVGEKTATDLITKYHSIDYIYENIETLDIKDSVKNKLIIGKESAFLSRDLGRICNTAPINTDIESYRIRSAKEPELAQLMTKLEFFKLMEKMNIKPVAVARNDEDNQESHQIFKGFTQLPESVNQITLYNRDDNYIAVWQNGYIVLNEAEFKEHLLSDIEKRVHDLKGLYKKYGDIKNVVLDAMLAGYLCNPSASSYEVEKLAQEYGVVTPKAEDEVDNVVLEALTFYYTCESLNNELKTTGQVELLRRIEIPLAKVLGDMEKVGFLVDKNGLKGLSNELAERITVLEKEIFSLVGYEFNLNSPKQLGIALFEKLGLPPKKKTKNGYSTNAEVLEELRNLHPAVSKLLEYRGLAKLKSTYADGLQACIGEDGRIHTTFNQTEARTGRISSLEPNLQNIPVRTNEGRRLREFFIASEGKTLCDADYSQIELRVLASIAEDNNMISAFKEGIDIHTATASKVFNLPVDMVTPLMRSRAKAVNFGIVYGIGAFSLSKDIGVSRKEADMLIKNYLESYPKVAEYMENVIKKAKQEGFVSTLHGRRRYLPELNNSNRMVQAAGERIARNAPIQGTAADIIKLAMINVFERLKKEIPTAKLILQVHDELIVECDEKDSRLVCNILQEEMENSVIMSVKLTADAHFGRTWLEAKG